MTVKASAVFLLVLGSGIMAQAAVCGNGVGFQKCVAMPEPGAIPELVVCIGGLGGYLAWRRRRKAKETAPSGRGSDK